MADSWNAPNRFRSSSNLARNLQPTPPGGIPGQEGLRTPLVGPTLRLAPGAQRGGVKKMGGVAKRPRVHLPDSARLFRGGDVAKPAVLSIDYYFERPADGTAVSLGDEVFPTSQGALVCACACAR